MKLKRKREREPEIQREREQARVFAKGQNVLAGIAQRRRGSLLYCIYSYCELPLIKYLNTSLFSIQEAIFKKDPFTVIVIHINLLQQQQKSVCQLVFCFYYKA